MARTMKLMTLLACIVVFSGCSIAGTWKTVSVEPEEYADKFAFSTVTFGDDGKYSGTVKYGGREQTTTGEYSWDPMMMTLKVTPKEGEAREYKGQLWMGKKLTLNHEHEGTKMTGTLEKQVK